MNAGGISEAGRKQAEANKAEFHAKRREEELERAYNNTGGLPANLRYPYAMIDSGMDFLKIQIATYTPSSVELQGLLIRLQSLHTIHLAPLDMSIFYFYPSESCMQ